MMNDLVSILIPVYNREKLIEETVQSALNQTYKSIEIIIVDNKSTDNTWEALQKLALQDSRIRIFQNETNIGPVRNWKRCIDEASGEYGKILWSDDLIAPEFLENTVPFLEDEEVGFVFTGTEIFNDNTDVRTQDYFIGDTGAYNVENYIKGVLFGNNYPVSPGCAIFRLKDLRENLLVDIPNKISSDFSMHAIGNDLLIYLLTANKYSRFGFVNESLSFFRAHAGSISIQSNNGKLPLHYMLVKAYFVENYDGSFLTRLSTDIFLLLKLYKKNDYNLKKISDFYIVNNTYKISIYYLLVRVLNFRVIKKVFNIMIKRFE